jgi:predicted 3-demethylubiquinone-9 3-methyltransferase (glyoxalase superfamily)
MTNQIYPCLWFDNQAQTAAEFYCFIFSNSRITSASSMAVQFEIDGTKVMGLNGGPMFKINPSISLFVTCTTNEEIESLWQRLSEGGNAMMPLDKYPWSEKYGWMVDKYGMTWQLMLDELPPGRQKIIPSLLFVGDQFGKAEQAIMHYASIFQQSSIHHLEMYPEGGELTSGHLMCGRFSLNDNQFAAMDGPGNQEFNFNEGVSLVVECETQEEIDYYWEKLTEGGKEVQCGWLRDKFGISWQVIPKAIGSLMSDPEKGERVMQEVLKMIKLDLNTLMNA